jgi:septum formation protein
MPPASPQRIVLASGSPRRRQIALAEGWNVQILPPPASAEAEAAPRQPRETIEDYVVRMARTKGEAVAATGVTDLILACDTLSEVDGHALGKPRDRADAHRMLAALSGRTHRVLTGVWLRPCCKGGFKGGFECGPRPALEAVEESLLEMGPLSDEFLGWYLDSGLWRGKAGACGFQDERLPLRVVSGSESNVVGLPLERVRSLIAALDG